MTRKVWSRAHGYIQLQPTLDVYDAKPLVDVYIGSKWDLGLHPIEAERLARALLKTAAEARAKSKK